MSIFLWDWNFGVQQSKPLVEEPQSPKDGPYTVQYISEREAQRVATVGVVRGGCSSESSCIRPDYCWKGEVRYTTPCNNE